YLFIAHDLSVVDYICDRVAVMYVGKIVETTDTDTLFQKPQHPYTSALLSAIPKLNPRLRQLPIPLEGEIADPANAPTGCVFHPRCRYAKDQCRHDVPQLRETADDHWVRCHFAGELTFDELTETTRNPALETV
ncbi:MAG: ABC transporter ATP-binding protein, partial [Chloroflexota bacterium]